MVSQIRVGDRKRARLFQMSLHRGFNRIFVILWVLYCFTVVSYPFYLDWKSYGNAIELTLFRYDACTQRVLHDREDHEDCAAELKEGLRVDHELYKYGSNWAAIWTMSGWHLLWAMPVTLVILPLIAYWVIRYLAKIALWVVKGFRESES